MGTSLGDSPVVGLVLNIIVTVVADVDESFQQLLFDHD